MKKSDIFPNRFSEWGGGVVLGPNGQEVLRLNLDQLLVTEAHELMAVVLDALNDHYGKKAQATEGAKP